MPDNVILVGNTPIFDQLVREMASRGKRFESLLSGSAVDLRPAKAFISPLSWTAKAVPQMTDKPVLEKNVSLADLSAHLISLNHFIGDMVKEFGEKYPDACPVHITRLDELDGTVTIRVCQAEMVEQTDETVNAAAKPLSTLLNKGDPKVAHEYFHVRGEAAVLPPVVRTSIGEDDADALYMKTSTWGSDEE